MSSPKPVLIAVVVIVVLGIFAFVGINLLNPNKSAGTTDVVANPPSGCPGSTSIVVKSPEAGTQNISTTNSAFMQWTSSSGALIFTNYTLNPDSIYSDITGDRVLAVIKLSQEDKSKFAVGTFRKTPLTGTSTPNQYSSEYNISTVGLAGASFDDNASVVIDYLGKDYVCGTVKSQDSTSGINGKFIAKYIDKSI